MTVLCTVSARNANKSDSISTYRWNSNCFTFAANKKFPWLDSAVDAVLFKIKERRGDFIKKHRGFFEARGNGMAEILENWRCFLENWRFLWENGDIVGKSKVSAENSRLLWEAQNFYRKLKNPLGNSRFLREIKDSSRTINSLVSSRFLRGAQDFSTNFSTNFSTKFRVFSRSSKCLQEIQDSTRKLGSLEKFEVFSGSYRCL